MKRSSHSSLHVGDILAVTVVLVIVAALTALVFAFFLGRDTSSNGLPPDTGKDTEVVDPIETDPPQTDSPVTEAPETEAPDTEAPESQRQPVTELPAVTDSPVTDPPATDPPETEGDDTPVIAPVEITDAMLNLTDFSFLGNLKRELFADATDDGSWYNGKVVRDLTTGEVSHPWDRYKSTLDILDAHGGIYRKNADRKVIYLTFDTGYDNGNLVNVLNVLDEKGVDAIFFCTSDFASEENRVLLERMLDEGHLIGNHTDSHKNFLQLTDKQVAQEIKGFEVQLKTVLGDKYSRTAFLRAPYGAASERDLAIAQKMGYQTVFWSYTYKDYDVNNQYDTATALNLLKTGLHDGCVYLLHTVSTTNAKILGDFIDYARDQGYEIRRIDQ